MLTILQGVLRLDVCSDGGQRIRGDTRYTIHPGRSFEFGIHLERIDTYTVSRFRHCVQSLDVILRRVSLRLLKDGGTRANSHYSCVRTPMLIYI